MESANIAENSTGLRGLRAGDLLASSRFQAAKKELLAAIGDFQKKVSSVQPASTEASVQARYKEVLDRFQTQRGRELYFPYLTTGLGNGPFVELYDGSVKFDMISGIGFNLFGHAHPALMEETLDGLSSDIMQGNLQPGIEATRLMDLLTQQASKKSGLKTGWFSTCGTMANEVALKIIRQKHFPASKIFAFKDCFAGRSTAMQEITDNPKYREGQPIFGEVHYLSFYSKELGVKGSLDRVTAEMNSVCERYPGKMAAVMIELVQGEGGFNFAPREWYVGLFENAKKHGLAIWADEIQTFARTGELFAFEKFDLGNYIDVATVAKALQASAVLFRPEYNPRAGLIAGTFTGSITALRSGRRVLEMLTQDGYLGENGKIQKLSRVFESKLRSLQERKKISEVRVIGSMIAFQPGQGTMDQVKALLFKLYERGVVAFYCGHDPYLVRMLPPFGVMTEDQVHQVCSIVEECL
ncbi:MAG: aminotransferase class III-fold pyridoxal phosphate-dependent enzyme [Bdellovibrionales bacterium]|nr:aminotransferase class III-fold pyridoxal phosphate-dependent enzyme [Bdellovibrionales bacterium]